MARKKNKKDNLLVPGKQKQELQVNYISELETNPKYSLDVDPENKYKFSGELKNFIQQFIQFKNVNTAAEVCGIEKEEAWQIFTNYDVQKEIRRINMALYQRQFASKLLNLDQIGGYLSSVLTDNFVPLANQISTTDKLKVADMLIKVINMKNQALEDPGEIMNKDIESQVKELSIDTIQQMLKQNNKRKERIEILGKINKEDSLSPEEKSYLESLSTDELLKLVNDINKKEKK